MAQHKQNHFMVRINKGGQIKSISPMPTAHIVNYIVQLTAIIIMNHLTRPLIDRYVSKTSIHRFRGHNSLSINGSADCWSMLYYIHLLHTARKWTKIELFTGFKYGIFGNLLNWIHNQVSRKLLFIHWFNIIFLSFLSLYRLLHG